MSITKHSNKALRIGELNDQLRRNRGLHGKVLLTSGVSALEPVERNAVIMAAMTFNDFNEDNDPHGEHDFARFNVNGTWYNWKIDYYARKEDGSMDEMAGSEDPSNTKQTFRVMTIMRADEY